jgi:hypothetical protein
MLEIELVITADVARFHRTPSRKSKIVERVNKGCHLLARDIMLTPDGTWYNIGTFSWVKGEDVVEE